MIVNRNLKRNKIQSIRVNSELYNKFVETLDEKYNYYFSDYQKKRLKKTRGRTSTADVFENFMHDFIKENELQ